MLSAKSLPEDCFHIKKQKLVWRVKDLTALVQTTRANLYIFLHGFLYK